MKFTNLITVSLVVLFSATMFSFTSEEEKGPKASINHLVEKEITVEYLQSVDRLIITTDDSVNVQSFKVIISPKKGTAVFTEMNGNRIPRHIHDKMIAVAPKTLIIIDHVMGITPSGIKVMCQPMVYEILVPEPEEVEED